MSRPGFLFSALVALATMFAFDSARAANTYVWTGATNSTWTVNVNWSPTRSVPASDDVLRFETGTYTVTGVPSQAIGQLVLANGASVTLVAAIGGGAKIVQLTGGSGVDLDIPAGTSLNMLGTFTTEIWVNTGATGTIAGNVDLDNGAHRLRSADPGGLVVAAGGRVRTLTAYSGAVFGQTSLNSVVFQAGSTYEHGSGSNPFGAAAPNSVVIFEPGSLFRLMSTLSPSMSGRTYANFEYNGGFSATAIGANPLSIDSITVNSGALHIQLSGSVSIRGSIRIADGASLRLGPTTGTATYALNGATTQNLWLHHADYPGDTSFDLTAGTTLRIDNPENVQCPIFGPAISGKLEFDLGNLVIPAFPSGNPLFLWGQGEVIGASQSTGWVQGGEIWAPATPSSPSRLFPLGDATSYTPLHVTYHGLADSLPLTVVAIVPYPPNYYYPYFTMAQLDSTKKVSRVHILFERTNEPIAYTDFDLTLGWGPGDVDPGADPNAFALRARSYEFDPRILPFHDESVIARTATSITATGVTRRNDTNDTLYELVVGEPAVAQFRVNADAAAAEGTPPGFGGTIVFPVSLLPAAVSTVHVDYATQDGTATVADGDYAPVSGTITFAPGDTVKYVTVALTADATLELHESLGLVLSNPFGGEIADGTAVGTVLDDDDVTPPSVTVIAPNGGESYVAGSVVNLEWSVTDDVLVDRVELRIKRGSSPVEIVALDVPNTGTYAWTSTLPLASTVRLLVSAYDNHGNHANDLSDGDWTLTDATDAGPSPSLVFALGAIAPNPVNERSSATLEYTLPREAVVDLSVLDVRGRRVRSLETGTRPAGTHRAAWRSDGLAPGLYFIRFRAPGFEAVRRVVVTS